MSELLLQMQNITKTFSKNSVRALDSANLVIARNTIHAVVGENGAGKSTLMHILSGELLPDSGSIYLEGKMISFDTPNASLEKGIGMLHQQLKLIPSLSVLENIILGNEPSRKTVIINKKTAYNRIIALSGEFNIYVDPDKKVSALNSDEKQKTALLSILFHNIKILILDEPTTFFSETKADTVHKLIRKLKSKGKSIIIVTHKLKEAIELSDTITVMKSGKTIKKLTDSNKEINTLTKLVLGNQVLSNLKKEQIHPGSVILEAKNLCYTKNRTELLKINFILRKKEITAVTGIRENGLEILEKILSGGLKKTSGDILHRSRNMGEKKLNLRDMNAGYIPSDRIKTGTSIKSTIAENMILLKYKSLTKRGLLDSKKITTFTNKLLNEYNIKGENSQNMGTLSGGNIQRVMIAREIENNPDFFIFAEPSRGLDIKSRNIIYEKIFAMKENGAGIFIISSDIDEVIQLADKLIILHNGQEAATLGKENINKAYIGEIMLGLEN